RNRCCWKNHTRKEISQKKIKLVLMREIALIGKYGKGKSAIVDDDVYEWASKLKLFLLAKKDGYKCVAMTNKTGKLTYLHREIIKAKKKQPIRFIDKNYLDCRRENLEYRENNEIEIDQITKGAKIKLYGKYGNGKYALVDIEDF